MKIRRGIYGILNFKEDIKYIGSSVNIYNRIFDHKSRLKRNTHYNKQLQDDYNRLGKQWFKFVIIEDIEDETKLQTKEREYIELLRKETKLYNQSLPDDNKGTLSHSEETIDKIRNSAKKFIEDNPELVKENERKAKLAIQEDKKLHPEKYLRKDADLKKQKIVAEGSTICHIFNSITEASQTLNLEYKRIGEVLAGRKNVGKGLYREVYLHKGWRFYYYNNRYNQKVEVNIIRDTSIGFENFE